MPLPSFLKPYAEEAKKLIEKQQIRSIEFSGRTYQIEVLSKEGNSLWTFMQLDQKGHVKDCFCSCQEAEEGGCAHLAASFLEIYRKHGSPLHHRFQASFWNQIFLIFANRLGYEPRVLKRVARGQFASYSAGGKVVFYIKGKTAGGIAKLQEIIEERKVETEDTSLKFSGLPPEELALWREGKPSRQLQYELSFWSDLAKWMMLMQEESVDYRIEFGFDAEKLPNRIYIHFPDIDVEFYLSKANLQQIIPTLNTVNSPLQVHHPHQKTIKQIHYEKEEKALIIEQKKGAIPEKLLKKSRGIELDGWYYIPDDGFYTQDTHGFLGGKSVVGKEIGQLLNKQWRMVKSLLVDTEIHEEPIQAKYSVQFDADWNLHINCYLFQPGDLSTPYSQGFGNWVYKEGDGFYSLEEVYFDSIETVVDKDDVPGFVQQHRGWLNTIEGFTTHVTSLQAQLSYELSDDNYLTFERKVQLEDAELECKDFGSWVYVTGQGFYSKVRSNVGIPVHPGMALSPEQIPLFIKVNQEDLKLIPGFFSVRCPVKKPGVCIQLLDEEQILVTPEYDLVPAYRKKDVRFFDDYVYVKGEGFHELPANTKIPDRFRNSVLIEKENAPLFLSFELDNLQKSAIHTDPQLIKPKKLDLVSKQLSRTADGYQAEFVYQTSNGEIPLMAIWSAIKKKEQFLFSDAGLISLEEERFDWIRSIKKRQVNLSRNLLKLSTLDLMRIHALEPIQTLKEDETSESLLRELTEFRVPTEPELSGLQCELRPYQKLGVHWLWFLYTHQLGGLLCDDMGLGKTHQAMALIAALRNAGGHLPILVICPTSVIYHWEEKLQKFYPESNVLTYHGLQRSLKDFDDKHDILLTSYNLWRREKELAKYEFELAIFDEIQAAKNPTSRLHQSLTKVKAKMCLGLTGTPIENRLRELKAIFDLVIPSYMPSDQEYRKFFVKPIERDENPERKELLRRFIKPFILRRKKSDVLLDLPAKTEEIAHCNLSSDQALLYTEVLNKSREQILSELSDREHPVPYIHVFAILSALKQICNHPAAYLKTPEDYKNYDSGKWDLFIELLEEARNSQQKVVVFSQYLGMLDIIENYLKENEIEYATIRGATQNRGEQVRRFNQDPRCEVFVGSLHAAGWGIDLTAASVVIHYDRWWNAARENQATDRVHRIGQVRGVQVFKLVTKGTFEERIDELIRTKGRLMEEVVGIDDHRLVKLFDREEIISLLQDVRIETD